MNGHRSPASTNQGVKCSMPVAHLKPKRQPITNEMLGQMLSQLDRNHKPSHDRLAAIMLGFFGLLRVSEFTVPNQHGFNPDHMYMYTCSGAKKIQMERPFLHKGFPWHFHVLDDYCTVAIFPSPLCVALSHTTLNLLP